ncbi:hypothetical protein Tco_0489322 [Tanacetum coccineum]
MHTTMVPEQVKPQKIQAGVQVSRLEDKDVIFSIGSALDDVVSNAQYPTGLPILNGSMSYRNGSLARVFGRTPVMAISVISVSLDSSEDSTDTTVIPTEIPIIAPTIPPSPDYTPASPDYSPISDMEFDPSEDPS